MSEHTPGPWVGFLDGEHVMAIKPAGRPGDVCQFWLPPTDADARLIAAAPDLLDAILYSDDAHWTPAMRAAMLKATGYGYE
jgi:hypothetical protein